MKRVSMASALLVIGAMGLRAQSPDAASVLAGVRQALGGDAAIAAIQTLSLQGMETRTMGGHSASASVEYACVLPDRCIKVRRMPSPFGADIVETSGFNGETHIRRRASDIPYPPDPFANETADQKMERARRAALGTRHEMARVLIPVLGVPAVDPVDVAYVGQESLDGKPMDVLQLRAADGYDARLYVDASTHLPAMISWMGLPEIVMSTSSTVTVRQGETPRMPPMMPPPMISGDPTAGVAKVERRLYFTEYRTQDGLTRARRFREMAAGSIVVESRLNTLKINPKLDPKRFDPAR
jgi:hypothetical protein